MFALLVLYIQCILSADEKSYIDPEHVGDARLTTKFTEAWVKKKVKKKNYNYKIWTKK